MAVLGYTAGYLLIQRKDRCDTETFAVSGMGEDYAADNGNISRR